MTNLKALSATTASILGLVLLTLLSTIGTARAAAFTSKATGNWSSSGQTTWNEVGVPGNGDTVTIQTGHNVTVDVNTTIGTSGAAGTEAVKVNTTGTLIVSTGATFTVRGDVNVNDTTITMNAGSTWTFDDNSSAAVYRLNLSTAHNQQNPKLICNGTVGSRVTFQSKLGGVNGRVTDGGFLKGGQVDCIHTNFTRIGSASTNAFEVFLNGSDIFRLGTSVILTSSGPIKMTGNPHATSTYTLDGITTISSVGSIAFDLTFNTTPSSGSYSVTNCVFDKGGNIFNIVGLTLTGNSFGGDPIFLDGTGPTITGNLFQHPSGDLAIYNDVTNNFILMTTTVNPHGMQISGNRDISITGNIAEYTGSTADGDAFTVISPAAARTYTFKHNLILPADGDVNNVSSGKVVSQLGGVNNTIVIEHNTFNVGVSLEGGVGIAETFNGFVGMDPSIQNNLAWSNSGFGYIVQNQAGAPVANYITVANYNGRTAMTGSYNVPGGTIQFGNGVNDVIGDPQFVDKTRNIKTWDASLGGPGTSANAVTELGKRNNVSGYNSAYTIAALMAYVKAGFAPNNAAFRSAHDYITPSNGWMGAVQGSFSRFPLTRDRDPRP